ncbi:putative GRX1-glutaredoxin [Violaceomyces palustris]|uniref:GRX1-glutaredoxin n=1 Tax=Violaceomyces palustris TaxID=1673888 RepID=A0ACD0NRR7_9BASI|nr:putative GRX1-glutaredoxin [Violaceomyces palustris]
MAAKQVAEKLISEHLVTIFSKTYCPYCTKAKGVIGSLGLDSSKVGLIELDTREDGGEIQSYLAEKTGQRTVPNIFINGNHLGGCDDILKAQASGNLQKLISA